MSEARRRPALRREDVVEAALRVLSRAGLPDLTMRALGTELGVRQSAIYHHVASKQALLGAVADEILARGPSPEDPHPPAHAGPSPFAAVRTRCEQIRSAVLAYPDGADVVMSMWAFGLGAQEPPRELADLLVAAGVAPEQAGTAARTLLHFVYGHAHGEQSRAQAVRAGIAMPADGDDFAAGLQLLLTGLAHDVG